MTKRELAEMLAPYGDDDPVVFVAFEGGVLVYEEAEVARGHGTTRVNADGGRDMPVAIYLVGEAREGQPRPPVGAALPSWAELGGDRPTPPPGFLDYPVALRPDAVVVVRNVPADLTAREAERIGAVLRAVAAEEGGEL